MTRLAIDQLTLWITAAAHEHGLDLAAHIEERTGASHRATLNALKRLVDADWLTRSGTSRRPVYAPGLLRQVVKTYTLHQLQEDVIWQRDFSPHVELPRPVQRMVQHGFTELVNNAIDHSGGTSVTISLRQTPRHAQLLVSDDGCGVFDKICNTYELTDAQHAMLELSKGRLTTQPQAHTGRGLFFSSQLADIFDIHANGKAFQRRAWEGNAWAPGRGLPRQGSSIYMAVALDTPRTLEQVLGQWSVDGSGIAFDQTRVMLKLVVGPGQMLDSRAQARRVAARLPQFKRAEVDFTDVNDVGHAFADELFRVFARAHQQVELVPINMTKRVAALIEAARSA